MRTEQGRPAVGCLGGPAPPLLQPWHPVLSRFPWGLHLRMDGAGAPEAAGHGDIIQTAGVGRKAPKEHPGLVGRQ